MKASFLYLNALAAVGGIQSFNRNFLRACDKIACEEEVTFIAFSLLDKKRDLIPFENVQKRSAEGNKLSFLFKAFKGSIGVDKIIFGHFNLLFPLALLFRLFSPKTQLILIAHGVEAWRPLPFYKRICLGCCHTILAVSQFTKEKIVSLHGFDSERILIFPNTLNPSFQNAIQSANPNAVFKKHQLTRTDKILFTLCRLSAVEKQKGYETVIRILPKLVQTYPTLRYFLAGKEEDIKERIRIEQLIKELKLQKHVILTGYLSDEKLPDYYAACDVFIMPSVKEGFGIVFLEALAFGKTVIGGDRDGSREALCNGELGILINPFDNAEVYKAVFDTLSGDIAEKYQDAKYLQQKAAEKFGFDIFYTRTKRLLMKPHTNTLPTTEL